MDQLISLWDFHNFQAISLGAIAGEFVFSISQYLVCALVSPHFNEDRDFDLNVFQSEQRQSYLWAFFVLVAISIGINIGGSMIGVQKWMSENSVVLPMLIAVAVPLFVPKQWAQIAGGVAFAGLNIAYLLIYYPILR